MWFADIELVRRLTEKHGAPTPIVDCGGLERPCVADYARTIDAMQKHRAEVHWQWDDHRRDDVILDPHIVRAAQAARYLNIARPLSFLGDYIIENPETGGLPLERLTERYRGAAGIGTAIVLSVLEHVADPFEAIACLRDAMKPGGLCIVSVPWAFPSHYGPEDCWRISETGLRHIFSPLAGSDEPPRWEILETGQHVSVDAEDGVLDGAGKMQIVKGVFIAARAV